MIKDLLVSTFHLDLASHYNSAFSLALTYDPILVCRVLLDTFIIAPRHIHKRTRIPSRSTTNLKAVAGHGQALRHVQHASNPTGVPNAPMAIGAHSSAGSGGFGMSRCRKRSSIWSRCPAAAAARRLPPARRRLRASSPMGTLRTRSAAHIASQSRRRPRSRARISVRGTGGPPTRPGRSTTSTPHRRSHKQSTSTLTGS